MHIERHQYEAAYKLGLERHEGNKGIAEALQELRGTGLKDSTAGSFIYNVSHLLKGQVYKRGLSLDVIEDYLTWIRRDRGQEGLANALTALEKHIHYRENESPQRSPQPGQREVLARHKALLAVPDTSAVLLRWKDGEAANYSDVLPLDWFATSDPKLGVIHKTMGPRGARSMSQCNVSVEGLTAELDYERFGAFNEARGMFLGVARLHFADEDLTAIERVEWKPEGAAAFVDCRFETPNFELPPAPPYLPPTEADGKTLQMVRERPGQAAFRRNVKAAYNLRCCMTGCTVAEALEGAHIDPYKAPASDSLRNGLLLRRDVHALFDKHLIAIDPDTHLIHVATKARGVDDYAKLHGVKLTLPAQPSHHPDPGALKRRWPQFRSD